MYVATKLNADNDLNGNPRRLYIVERVDQVESLNAEGYRNINFHTTRLAIIDEGYEGIQALKSRFPKAALLSTQVTISATEYKYFINVMKRMEKANKDLEEMIDHDANFARLLNQTV